MYNIKYFIDNAENRSGKTFSLIIQLLIVISLITFSIGTLPDLSTKTQSVLNHIEAIIIGIFTFEYILRVFVSDKRFKYIFSFYGLIDLAAILPFYLATGLDFRAIRIFRLFRLLRILKLLKYNQAIKKLQRAFIMVKEELILFGFVTIFVLYISAVAIYFFEYPAQPELFSSVFHSLWWAVTTLTTVGYGDMYPITAGGRVFTFFVLMVGLGIVAVPTGLIASALSKVRDDDSET